MATPTVTRRRVLTLTSIGLASLAGCSGGGESDSGDGGSDDETDDADAEAEAQADEGGSDDSSDETEDETEDEQTAEDVENRDPGTDVLEFQDLEIIEHEATVEEAESEYDDDTLIVTGVVKNHDEDKYDNVVVGVRAYDVDGHQIDQFLDSTGDLQGGGTWKFEVEAYNVPAGEIEDWDIGVKGTQF